MAKLATLDRALFLATDGSRNVSSGRYRYSKTRGFFFWPSVGLWTSLALTPLVRFVHTDNRTEEIDNLDNLQTI